MTERIVVSIDMSVSVDGVLSYWLDEVGPEGWYRGDEALDREITEEFATTYEQACDGALSLWLTYASGTLAYIILTDQFSRNMFRGTGKAFETDGIARAAAKVALAKGWDMKIDGAPRQFFYLPLMHSECLEDQERCIRLMDTRMEDSDLNLLHAQAHREVIRRFGRFPTRNEALGRASSEDELRYLDEGGYGAIVEKLKAA